MILNTSFTATFIFLGKPISEVYDNWRVGEPNSDGGEEDCVELYRQGYLNDKSCDKKFRFICKKSLKTLEWNHNCNMSDLSKLFLQHANFMLLSIKHCPPGLLHQQNHNSVDITLLDDVVRN